MALLFLWIWGLRRCGWFIFTENYWHVTMSTDTTESIKRCLWPEYCYWRAIKNDPSHRSHILFALLQSGRTGAFSPGQQGCEYLPNQENQNLWLLDVNVLFMTAFITLKVFILLLMWAFYLPLLFNYAFFIIQIHLWPVLILFITVYYMLHQIFTRPGICGNIILYSCLKSQIK